MELGSHRRGEGDPGQVPLILIHVVHGNLFIHLIHIICFIRSSPSSSTPPSPQESLSVASLAIHPNYTATSLHHDICLLTLAQSATLSPTIATIGLPEEGEEYAEGRECRVAGWGRQAYGGRLADALQKVGHP